MKEEKEGEFVNLSMIEDEENYDNKEFYLTKLSCEICKRQFSTTNGLKNHKLIHYNRPFNCFNCGLQFLGLKRFSEHMRRYRSVNCNICGKNIQSKNFSRHYKSCAIKKEEVKPKREEFSCNFCDFKSMHKRNLKLHSDNMHSKRFCIYCDEEFDNKGTLYKHTRKVHKQKKDPKIFSCKWENCTYSSKNSSNVRSHEKFSCSKSFEVVTWF